jgi:ribosomal protein L11 methyltransferase
MRWAEIEVSAGPLAQELVADLVSDLCGGASLSGDHLCVTGWLPADDRVEDRLLLLRSRLDALPSEVSASPVEITVRPVEDNGWLLAYREFFQPVTAGRFHIRPPWGEVADDRSLVDLIVDPGMAFGTGHHPTTRMMLEVLSEMPPAGLSVLDAGAGSAILSVAAAKLGAASVLAVEVDSSAEENALLNIRLNGVGDRVRFVLEDGPPEGEGPFDAAVMNIVADVIIALAPRVRQALRPDAWLACSGVIDSRLDEVTRALEELRFEILEVRESGEWRAIICRRT